MVARKTREHDMTGKTGQAIEAICGIQLRVCTCTQLGCLRWHASNHGGMLQCTMAEMCPASPWEGVWEQLRIKTFRKTDLTLADGNIAT